MSKFYITERDVERCKGSRDTRSTIIVNGITSDGEVRAFGGPVKCVEEDMARPADKRWLVTMHE